MFLHCTPPRHGISVARIIIAAILLMMVMCAQAASTDIADEPLITMSDVAAKPNIMFILDNSGSMGSACMPDEACYTYYSYYSAQCNGVAYDPSITYSPPLKADGTSYSAATFSSALSDGFDDDSTKTSLANQFYYTYGGSQAAMSWTYDSSGDVDTSTAFYKECRNINNQGNGKFTLISTDSLSSTARQNYANWYSYYRTRRLLMRSAVGRAFTSLGSSYRVGFTTISDTGISDGTNYFRNVKDFDSTQKSNFYTSLYNATGTGTTPLRGALSKVGRYFAKNISGQSYDPMEYSCQRNFAILSTDGYWNTGAESTSSKYGPYQLGGSSYVGNQDSAEVRPMFDGTTSTTTWSRNKYVVGAKGVGCSNNNRYLYTLTVQTSTDGGTTWADASPESDCVNQNTSINGSTAAALAGTTTYSSTTSSTSTTGGSSNSLADVAEYFYKTDLRTSTLGNCTSSTSGSSEDVCSNSLVATDSNAATWQHLATYTIGLGVNGTLTYDKNYLTQTSGAYIDLTNGTSDWPTPTETTSGGDARNIDDLWHAAVNGRGQYYSAMSASALSEAISGVVTSIQAVTGSASAASTNKLELISGSSNMAYQASYTTSSWVGDLAAYSLDGATGTVNSSASWSAQTLLDSVTASSRKIYFNSSGTLTSFSYNNLSATQKGYFDNLCTQSTIASQCSGLSTSNLALANSGTNLVNYLRGERTYETSNSTSPLYRTRSHVLGDIINSTPVYSGEPPFSYTDTGYASFKSVNSSRTEMVYVGANDGMLHAFKAETGEEAWAFVPTTVMSNMYKLANSSYSTQHSYFVDGAPVVGDIYVDGAWKTILVGGLNSGGKAYYALDVTTPESPKVLWEFTDTDLGLTFGNPVIAKRADGTWVVVFASGYNNTTGDGLGHLYVLNANTGIELMDITTSAGSSTSPSGLAKINAWIDDSSNNTALRYYGGDLLGNLWRFDIDGLYEPKQSALLLAQFQDSSGTAQPITVQPRLKLLSSTYPVVIVGTGRYLGISDITDTGTQSVAVFKDPLINSGWGVLRNNSTMVEQDLTATTSTVSSTSNSVSWSSKNGWWFDLPTAGERVISNMVMSGNTLYLGTAIPEGSACVAGGSSWLYTVNLLSGVASAYLYSDSALIVGLNVLTTSSGDQVILIKDSAGTTKTATGDATISSSSTSAHRTSWREIVN